MLAPHEKFSETFPKKVIFKLSDLTLPRVLNIESSMNYLLNTWTAIYPWTGKIPDATSADELQ